MSQFNVGDTMVFDYTDAAGKVSLNRQVIIEASRPYGGGTLVTGFTTGEDGRKSYRSFHSEKMLNLRTV